jgi:ribosomal protein L29
MKSKQKKALQEKSVAELQKLIGREKEAISKAALKFDEGKDKNILKKKRHDIARMMTYIREKEMKG